MKNSINENIANNLRSYLAGPSRDQAVMIGGDWGCGKTHFINDFISQETPGNLKLIKVSLFGLRSIFEVERRILTGIYPLLNSKAIRLLGGAAKKISGLVGLNLVGSEEPEFEAAISVEKIDLYSVLIGDRNDFALILDDLERTNIAVQDLLGYINHIVETCQIKTILIANESELWRDSLDSYNKFKEKVIGKTFCVAEDVGAAIETFLLGNIEIQRFKPVMLEAYASTRSRNLRSLRQVVDDFSQFYEVLGSEYRPHDQYTHSLAKTFFSLGLSAKCAFINKAELLSGKVFESGSMFMKKYFLTGRPVLSEEFWAKVIFDSDYSRLNIESSKSYFFDVPPPSEEEDILEKLRNFQGLEYGEFRRLLSKLESEVKCGSDCKPVRYIRKSALLASIIAAGLSTVSTRELASNISTYIYDNDGSESWKLESPDQISRYEIEGLINSPMLNNSYNRFLEKHRRAYELGCIEKTNESKSSKASEFYQALKVNDRNVLARLLIKDSSHTAFFTSIDADRFALVLLEAPNAAIISFSEIVSHRYVADMLRPIRENNEFILEGPFWEEAVTAIQCYIESADLLKRHNLKSLLAAIVNFQSMISVHVDSSQE